MASKLDSEVHMQQKEDTEAADEFDTQYSSDNSTSGAVKEVFSVEQIDPVLAKKMALINDAIDSIGMTRFQWKMFVLNGFGYAVDSVSRKPSNRIVYMS